MEIKEEGLEFGDGAGDVNMVPENARGYGYENKL
jgi:hypothetical protein